MRADMSVYTPDHWVIVKLEGENVPDGILYKVLAGWYGGYLGSDSWKLNSGITKIVDKGDHYAIDGYSGSRYLCFKNSERLGSYTASIFKDLAIELEGEATIEVVPVESILDTFK